jgi:hypothetical protein
MMRGGTKAKHSRSQLIANGIVERSMNKREKFPQVQQIERQLQQTMDELRRNVTEVDEPQLKAFLEESAEVIGALVKTLKDYEAKNEPAWQ